MSNPFVAEVRAFGFSFAPRGWAFCNGQIMAISQNTALFSLLGTFYGGDGKSTFQLPNLEGNIAISQGQGQGLSDYFIGQPGGTQNVTLNQSEMPMHNHNLMTDTAHAPDAGSPVTAALGKSPNTQLYSSATSPLVNMNPAAIGAAGNSVPHNNMMPYLCLNFCIALQGVYPPRT
jgi:microcystin-dependent protein